MKKILIFIPCYNEEKIIKHTVEALKESLSRNKIKDAVQDILIINDGSTDKTSNIISSLNIYAIEHPVNLGLGAATRSALEFAKNHGYDIAVKFDADLQHSPDDVTKVVFPIIQEKADIVFGSRFRGKINYRMPVIRYLGNKFFTYLMRVLTGWDISDAQTGLMAFSRRYLEVFNIMGNYNPPQQVLIDAYGKYMRYYEVPVVFNKRYSGQSFVSLKYPFKVFPLILKTLIYINPLKVFGLLGGFFISLSIILTAFVFHSYYILGREPIIGDATITIFFVTGIQLILFGFIADIVIQKK